MNHRVSRSLSPSPCAEPGKTPTGQQRYPCKAGRRPFSTARPLAKQVETTETTLIFALLVNNVPFRRILQVTGISAHRLYRRIEFLAGQCRLFSARRGRRLHKAFAGRNRVIATDVQTILVNWRHADRILSGPILHAATSERSSGFIIAVTTDYNEVVDPAEAEQRFIMAGDFMLPGAWRTHAGTRTLTEFADPISRGASRLLAPEEKKITNFHDLPGNGSRIRSGIFQNAQMMPARKLLGKACPLLSGLPRSCAVRAFCYRLFM
jgi:hypothetical protein